MIEAIIKKGKWVIPAVLLLLMHTAQAAVVFRAATSARQSSGDSITVSFPANAKPVSGDVLLASIAVVTNSSTVSTPSGWTLVQSSNQSSVNTSRLYTYYRVAGASEPASYAWTFTNVNSGAVAVVARFDGVDTTASPIDASAAQITSTLTRNFTAPSVKTTVAGDMLVTVHEYASSRHWTPPPGMTEAADLYSMSSAGSSGVSMELNTESRPAAGPTGTRTAKAATTKNRGAAHAIALKAVLVVATPGDFNIFDTSTAANATDGLIKTKVAGKSFTLDTVALNSAKTGQLTSFTGDVKVELLNASDNTAALDGNNCRSSWATIQTLSPNPSFIASNNGRLTVSFTENKVYRDVRVRITYPASGTPTKIGCSTDDFALRPDKFTGLTLSDADWQSAGTVRTLSNVGASGGVVHKAGRPFRIDALAQNAAGTGIAYGVAAGNYNGLPQGVLTSCLLPAGCTPGTLDELGAASTWTAGASAGSFYSATASYGDAGSFAMQLVDSSFAAVDGGDGTPADCSAAGQYVCSATTVNAGRFVPDHFELVDASLVDPDVDPAIDTWLPLPAPQFRTFNLTDAACNGAAPAPRRAFTYIGQPFGYVSVPQVTYKAMDAGDNPINNYQGALMKLGASAVTQTYGAAAGTLDTSLALQLPTLTLNANYTSGDSPVIGTIVVNAADRLAFVRTTPVAPFNAAISLSIALQDSSENAVTGNGTITAGAPVVFSPINFDAGNLMHFGRLKLSNALGSESLNLPIPVAAQFWNGTAFATNTLDNCTALSANNVALGNYQKSLSATNMGASHINPGTALLSGNGSLSLSKPSPAARGSVDIAINLGSLSSAQSCLTPAAPASTGANIAYLQGKWCGASHDRDPAVRATFGVFKNANEFIYMREMY